MGDSAFVAEQRLQAAHDARQLVLRAHDGADVLVRRRRFVAQLLGAAMIEPDAVELSHELACAESSAAPRCG